MSDVSTLLGEQVSVKLSGDVIFEGILTDLGQDILVLFNGIKYYYIPWMHIHMVYQTNELKEKIKNPNEPSITQEMETISYRKILLNAKGIFSEIYVTGNITFHGYVMNVLSDYLVFYSPVFHTMYISLSHLKWITPYNHKVVPYNLNDDTLSVHPSTTPLHRSFESQIKKEIGKLVIFDGGTDPMKIGRLNKVDNNQLVLCIASGENVYLKLAHIKSVHLP
ncbi:DUF2642 domain-containing protein [Gottfriedia sp. NPDC056225]|uniref:DUF2642 domain-containing protein n=1 Tax=Gottfriedia sp. NPDC056225 TaxID=3345751 RepID=UPI001558B70D|nr:DUF2642 domain-containing protein [Arthrobacter citreus]